MFCFKTYAFEDCVNSQDYNILSSYLKSALANVNTLDIATSENIASSEVKSQIEDFVIIDLVEDWKIIKIMPKSETKKNTKILSFIFDDTLKVIKLAYLIEGKTSNIQFYKGLYNKIGCRIDFLGTGVDGHTSVTLTMISEFRLKIDFYHYNKNQGKHDSIIKHVYFKK